MMLPPTIFRYMLFDKLNKEINAFLDELPSLPITPSITAQEIKDRLLKYDFDTPQDPEKIVNDCITLLRQWSLHSTHPRYYGLFNPSTTYISILADTLVAAFNPQLATWSHSPIGAGIERHVIKTFGMKFGFSGEKVVGTFTSGGAEANSSAVLVALIHHFPKIGEEGLRSLPAQPVMYVSEESHHSFLKIAHMSGLGGNAVRIIPTDDNLRMNLGILEQQIRNDRRAGCSPFFVVGTAGTTSSGIVDTLPEIADLCTKEKVWFHVDAAWGGAAILSRSLKYVLEGIDRADSITFDAHKWLSVPMGAGMFFCKDEELLWRTFGITTAYMPTKTSQLEVFDPYMYSAQWTRRFIGLKVFMSLAVEGFAGYEKVIDHQTAMGNLLRKELLTQGWNVTNTTPLPVVNFQDAHRQYAEFSYYEGLAESIIRRGKVWISATRVKKTIPVLRACITSYRTQPKDIESLIEELNHVRTEIG